MRRCGGGHGLLPSFGVVRLPVAITRKCSEGWGGTTTAQQGHILVIYFFGAMWWRWNLDSLLGKKFLYGFILQGEGGNVNSNVMLE